jgi:hypothetical protein
MTCSTWESHYGPDTSIALLSQPPVARYNGRIYKSLWKYDRLVRMRWNGMTEKLKLHGAENQLWHCAMSGEPFDLRTGVLEDDDILQGRTWPEERCIRAEVLTALLYHMGQAGSINTSTLQLSGARITGRILLAGADIVVTMLLEQCYLDEVPDLSEARTRSIRILKSKIPGLYAHHVNVDGRLDLSGSVVDGRLRLVNARVNDEFGLNGSKLLNPGGWTIFAGGITVEGAMFGRHGFESRGSIRLVGAHLNGGLFLDRAHLSAPEGSAFVADNLRVEGRMICDGLVAEGEIRLPGARINGQLSWDGAIIRADNTGLDLRRLVAEDLQLTPVQPIEGIVDLGSAHVSVFCDNPATWPSDLRLDGFTYDSLITLRGGSGDAGIAKYISDSANTSAEILPAADRLAWLRRTPTGYRPQPYEQLAIFYRRVGHDDEARKVLLAKQRSRRSTQGLAGKIWSYLLDLSVGYGYRPWLAALWLVALITLGTAVFAWRPPLALNPHTAPPFDPFVYTINLLLPVGQFIQANQWNPSGAERWFAYALVGTGWLLATTVIAGVTRVLSRS